MPPIKLEFGEGEWKGRNRRFRKNRFLVKIRDDNVSDSDVGARLAQVVDAVPGGRLLRRSGRWAVVRIPPGLAVLNAIKNLETGHPSLMQELDFVEPDFQVRALDSPGSGGEMPDDEYLKDPGDGSMWQWSAPAMGMGGAWVRQTGNDAVFIAVVDAGLETHAEIKVERFKNGGNFLDETLGDDPFEADGVFTDMVAVDDNVRDLDGHGVAMAGVIAALADNVHGIAGMNWGSPIGLCKALDDNANGSASSVLAAVLQAIEYAKLHGRRLVINLSLALEDPPLDDIRFPGGGEALTTFEYMCRVAQAAGAILVCGTGNDGGPVRTPALYAESFPDTVMAVGGTHLTTANDETEIEWVYDNSNRGNAVTVVAPGYALPVLKRFSGYDWDWGTSISTAYVTGLASLVWSHNPDLAAGEVIDCIKRTAWTPDSVEVHDERWGWGRVDASRALTGVEPRPLVSLAIDKSGSMTRASGTLGLTRMDVLRNAVDTVVHVLEPRSWVGVVGFNEVASEVAPAREIDEGDPEVSQTDVVDRVAQVTPSGFTSIGGGVESALEQAGTVADADVVGVPKRAIVLVTDGRQNRAPWINGPEGQPQLDTTNVPMPVFSIAAGTAEVVDTEALHTLSVDTAGADLTTGVWNDESEQTIAKFLCQHLTAVAGDSQVLDPAGHIKPGDGTVEVEFPVAADDRRAEVIMMMPAEGVVGLTLVSPQDVVLTPESAVPETGVEYRASDRVALFRVPLPYQPGAEASSHEGTWKAVFKANPAPFGQYLAALADAGVDTAKLERSGVPYTLIVNTRSRLRMDVRAQQSGCSPGAELMLRAEITLDKAAQGTDDTVVQAFVRSPAGDVSPLELPEVSAGCYELHTGLAHAGVYTCHVVATGTFRGHPFRREHALTASVCEPAAMVDEEAPPPPPTKPLPIQRRAR